MRRVMPEYPDSQIRAAINLAIRTTGWTDTGAIRSWAAHHLAEAVAEDGDHERAERQVQAYAERQAKGESR